MLLSATTPSNISLTGVLLQLLLAEQRMLTDIQVLLFFSSLTRTLVYVAFAGPFVPCLARKLKEYVPMSLRVSSYGFTIVRRVTQMLPRDFAGCKG